MKINIQNVDKLGFLHGFGQKLVIFTDFYFKENRPEKCVL